MEGHALKVPREQLHPAEQTIDALNLIKQTSLELEIILAYQMIDKMPLPAGLNIRHLIIDEVQDNSVFEFIYCFVW